MKEIKLCKCDTDRERMVVIVCVRVCIGAYVRESRVHVCVFVRMRASV